MSSECESPIILVDLKEVELRARAGYFFSRSVLVTVDTKPGGYLELRWWLPPKDSLPPWLKLDRVGRGIDKGYIWVKCRAWKLEAGIYEHIVSVDSNAQSGPVDILVRFIVEA